MLGCHNMMENLMLLLSTVEQCADNNENSENLPEANLLAPNNIVSSTTTMSSSGNYQESMIFSPEVVENVRLIYDAQANSSSYLSTTGCEWTSANHQESMGFLPKANFSSYPSTAWESSSANHQELMNCLPKVIENGRVSFGPPHNYVYPHRPSTECELFITRLPLNFNIENLMSRLSKFGKLYAARFICRGTNWFGFIRYFNVPDAMLAHELLNFSFIDEERPSVFLSKSRVTLQLRSIPKSLPIPTVMADLRKVFPEMDNCIVHEDKYQLGNNSGSAVVEFSEHEIATNVRKRFPPGVIYLWNNFVKIDWIKEDLSTGKNQFAGSFYKCVPDEFKSNDYSAKLRLFALANNFCIPIVVYGANCRNKGIQYAGILLSEPQSARVAIFLIEILNMTSVYDIHVLISETVARILEHSRGFPRQSYLLRVINGITAKILLGFNNFTELFNYIGKNTKRVFDEQSVLQLYAALHSLTLVDSETVLSHYKNSFMEARMNDLPFIKLNGVNTYSWFFCIYPKFRNNRPLNHNLNDTEIILLQGTTSLNGNTKSSHAIDEFLYDKRRVVGTFGLKSQNLLKNIDHIINFVDTQSVYDRSVFHPAQKMNTTPVFVRGHTYQKSIFENY